MDASDGSSSALSTFVLALPPARRRALREHPVAGCFALATASVTHRGLAWAVAELDALPEYQQAHIRLGRVTRPTVRAQRQAVALYGDRGLLTAALARDDDRRQNGIMGRVDDLNRDINSALRDVRGLRRSGTEPRRSVAGALAVLADLDRAYDIARALADDLDAGLAGDAAATWTAPVARAVRSPCAWPWVSSVTKPPAPDTRVTNR